MRLDNMRLLRAAATAGIWLMIVIGLAGSCVMTCMQFGCVERAVVVQVGPDTWPSLPATSQPATRPASQPAGGFVNNILNYLWSLKP